MNDNRQRARTWGKWHGYVAKGPHIFRGSKRICWGWSALFHLKQTEIEAWEARGGEKAEVGAARAAIRR